jgi:AcrR family transcriptional regulator
MPMSIGMGLVFVPITLLGTGGVRDDDAGLASGLFNTAQQVGGSLGLAILSTLAASRTAQVAHTATSHAAALASGYQVAFAAAAVMLGVGGLILAVGLRRRHLEGIEVELTPSTVRAGIGRGTLFRNYPTKEHLIAAIVVERMNEAIARGRELADADDPDAALFEFLEDTVGRQQTDRALFEAVEDTWLANADIRAAHAAFVGALETLLGRAQEAGAVRGDVGAMDVLMLLKGVCQAATAFAHLDPDIAARQLDLVRSALAPQTGATPALRGRAPTLDDIDAAFAPADAAPQVAAKQGI